VALKKIRYIEETLLEYQQELEKEEVPVNEIESKVEEIAGRVDKMRGRLLGESRIMFDLYKSKPVVKEPPEKPVLLYYLTDTNLWPLVGLARDAMYMWNMDRMPDGRQVQMEVLKYGQTLDTNEDFVSKRKLSVLVMQHPLRGLPEPGSDKTHDAITYSNPLTRRLNNMPVNETTELTTNHISDALEVIRSFDAIVIPEKLDDNNHLAFLYDAFCYAGPLGGNPHDLILQPKRYVTEELKKRNRVDMTVYDMVTKTANSRAKGRPFKRLCEGRTNAKDLKKDMELFLAEKILDKRHVTGRPCLYEHCEFSLKEPATAYLPKDIQIMPE